MLYNTRGIVLHSVKYAETSLIVRVYTESFGLQSYLLKGVRSPKSKIKSVLFQPLSLLDLVAYRKEKTGLQSVKEVKVDVPYHTVYTDIRKSSIALFLAELVYRSIREEEPNKALFDFLWNALLLLDRLEKSFSTFHLLFAVKLCRYLGFQPSMNRSDYNRFFHLREGSFHPLFLTPETSLNETESAWFFQLLKSELHALPLPDLPARIRHILLDKILLYYRLHLPGMKEIRAHKVLHTVLS